MIRIRMARAAAGVALAAGVLIATPSFANATTSDASTAPTASADDIGWGAPPAAPQPSPSPTASTKDIGWG
ncbi:hypothetical protein [Streptomyces sp. TBY4]|uniref:hypothetical protein n=1 Tax=Streptomyces sp. TBY4 TaxID=2962030 RepID=UPI0020B87FC2|nr:hypothetical protein [Streptomyces sp. TBY4]MCP3758233.1 hypothetical protein [Streptomyces sp. TBY4]